MIGDKPKKRDDKVDINIFIPEGLHELRTISQKFTLDLEDFGKYLMPILISISDPFGILIKDMKFLCKIEPNVDELNNGKNLISNLSRCGVGFFDYIMMRKFNIFYDKLSEKEKSLYIKPTWNKSINRKEFNESNYERCLFYLYFMLMTRAKVKLNENEPIPKFISSYIGLKCEVNEIYEMLGDVNFDRIDHKWIKSVVINKLPKPVRQRLESGFAGTRLITALINNIPVMKNDNNKKYHNIYEIVINHFNQLFWELHPFFTPDSMLNISISKNLLNLMILIYDEDQLKDMVKRKVIYSFPKFDQRYTQFENWTPDTFKDYKTPISGFNIVKSNVNKNKENQSNDSINSKRNSFAEDK